MQFKLQLSFMGAVTLITLIGFIITEIILWRRGDQALAVVRAIPVIISFCLLYYLKEERE